MGALHKDSCRGYQQGTLSIFLTTYTTPPFSTLRVVPTTLPAFFHVRRQERQELVAQHEHDFLKSQVLWRACPCHINPKPETLNLQLQPRHPEPWRLPPSDCRAIPRTA